MRSSLKPAAARLFAICLVQLILTPVAWADLPGAHPENVTLSPVSTPPEREKPTYDKTEPDTHLSFGYVKGIFLDTGTMLASPVRWDKSDWLKVGGVAATTGGLYLFDDAIRDSVQAHQTGFARNAATLGNLLGNPLYTLPPVGAFYLYGYLAEDSKAKKTALLAVESLAIASMFTESIKVLAERSRPSTGASPSTWDGPHLSMKNVSFSSGHTSSAFSIATVFAERYKDTWYVPPIAYGLASLTGLSRIYGNEHWASDVFFGAAIGYFVGKAVVRLHPDKERSGNNFTIVPMMGQNYKGLSLQCAF